MLRPLIQPTEPLEKIISELPIINGGSPYQVFHTARYTYTHRDRTLVAVVDVIGADRDREFLYYSQNGSQINQDGEVSPQFLQPVKISTILTYEVLEVEKRFVRPDTK